MFKKVLVCSRDVFFRLKILSFGKKCDEVVQMKSRGIRKAIFCEILTYSKRAESQLSPKVSLTTICDLHLLLRVSDRRGYFPSLRRSWCQFWCKFQIIWILLVLDSREISNPNSTTFISREGRRISLQTHSFQFESFSNKRVPNCYFLC